MQPPPRQLDGADVVWWALLDERVKPTGYCQHFVGGLPATPAVAFAICRYPLPNRGFYLFHCDEYWRVLIDTYHDTLDDAKRQAEREFTGISGKWHDIPVPGFAQESVS